MPIKTHELVSKCLDFEPMDGCEHCNGHLVSNDYAKRIQYEEWYSQSEVDELNLKILALESLCEGKEYSKEILRREHTETLEQLKKELKDKETDGFTADEWNSNKDILFVRASDIDSVFDKFLSGDMAAANTGGVVEVAKEQEGCKSPHHLSQSSSENGKALTESCETVSLVRSEQDIPVGDSNTSQSPQDLCLCGHPRYIHKIGEGCNWREDEEYICKCEEFRKVE